LVTIRVRGIEVRGALMSGRPEGGGAGRTHPSSEIAKSCPKLDAAKGHRPSWRSVR
jgi:hypothetical protein